VGVGDGVCDGEGVGVGVGLGVGFGVCDGFGVGDGCAVGLELGEGGWPWGGGPPLPLLTGGFGGPSTPLVCASFVPGLS
jgi:hypothetical protein